MTTTRTTSHPSYLFNPDRLAVDAQETILKYSCNSYPNYTSQSLVNRCAHGALKDLMARGHLFKSIHPGISPPQLPPPLSKEATKNEKQEWLNKCYLVYQQAHRQQRSFLANMEAQWCLITRYPLDPQAKKITGLYIDDDHSLLIATVNRVYRMASNENIEPADDLQHLANTCCRAVLPNGRMVYGTVDGEIRCQRESLEKTEWVSYPPPREVSINRDKVTSLVPMENGEVICTWRNKPKIGSFNPSNNHFRIEEGSSSLKGKAIAVPGEDGKSFIVCNKTETKHCYRKNKKDIKVTSYNSNNLKTSAVKSLSNGMIVSFGFNGIDKNIMRVADPKVDGAYWDWEIRYRSAQVKLETQIYHPLILLEGGRIITCYLDGFVHCADLQQKKDVPFGRRFACSESTLPENLKCALPSTLAAEIITCAPCGSTAFYLGLKTGEIAVANFGAQSAAKEIKGGCCHVM